MEEWGHNEEIKDESKTPNRAKTKSWSSISNGWCLSSKGPTIFVVCNIHLFLGSIPPLVHSFPRQTSHGPGIFSISRSPLQPRLHTHSFTEWPVMTSFLLGLQWWEVALQQWLNKDNWTLTIHLKQEYSSKSFDNLFLQISLYWNHTFSMKWRRKIRICIWEFLWEDPVWVRG